MDGEELNCQEFWSLHTILTKLVHGLLVAGTSVEHGSRDDDTKQCPTVLLESRKTHIVSFAGC